MSDSYFLDMEHISKTFPGVKALNDVSLKVRRGEVIGLVGINGAGKTTLMNVLSGILKKDEGTIRINGKEVQIENPLDAEKNGIAIIHQESVNFQFMTVAENLYINHLNRFRKGGILRYKEMFDSAKQDLLKVGCQVDPSISISEITIGEKQMVEIARALNQGADIILFDEPTSSLTFHEKNVLFSLIRNLKENGKTVIYISHFLDEILEICDGVVVMVNGQVVKTMRADETTLSQVIEYMVGHKSTELCADFRINKEKPVVSVKNMSAGTKVQDVSFTVYEGEILGFWGLLGSGRTEIVRALLGLDKRNGGEIVYYDSSGKSIPVRNRKMMDYCGYVTENRHDDGLFLRLPVYQNFSVSQLREYADSFGLMRKDREKKRLSEFVERLKIKLPGYSARAEQLSGGNQQKLIISRWISMDKHFYIFDEPTRGVDVDAKTQIHQLIFDLARAGNGILVISSEIEECMTLATKIDVIRKGRLVGELSREEATENKLMAMCMGEEA